MREIKFRVWTGSKMEHNVMAGFLGAFYVQGLDEKDSASMSPMNTKYYEPVRIMQFTGLTDKEGKPIYEGDILKPSIGSPTIIFYHEGTASFNVKYANDDDYFRAIGNAETSVYLTVIGNIYEHPALLEEKEG